MDKIKKGKAKGTWNSPSPDYYQSVVLEVLHKINSPAGKQKRPGYSPSPDHYQVIVAKLCHINEVTRSNFGEKEESPYKPESWSSKCFKAVGS